MFKKKQPRNSNFNFKVNWEGERYITGCFNLAGKEISAPFR